MFLMMLAAAIVASVPLFGGRLELLPTIRLRKWWLVLAALAVQVLVISVFPGMPGALAAALHVATYAAAGFFIWLNRSVPGMVLLGTGAALNVVAITANGGTLPASAAAVRRAGWTPDPHDFANSAALPHPVLGFLGDNYTSPAFLPFRNVFSIGDLVILVGAAVCVHVTCRTALARLGRGIAGGRLLGVRRRRSAAG